MKALLTGLLLTMTTFYSFSNEINMDRLSSIDCLALNMYHEGRGESDLANIVISSVVLNRVYDVRYPNTICEVVYQYKQFSWTHDKISDYPKDKRQYHRLYKLSEELLINRTTYLTVSKGVTHYHAKHITPFWVKDRNIVRVMSIDNHIFYKWRR